MTPILRVSGIGPRLAAMLAEKDILTAEQLATTSRAVLLDIPAIGVRRVETLLAAARMAVEGTPTNLSKVPEAPAQAAALETPQKAPAEAEPVTIAKKVETSTGPKKSTIKDDKDNKRASVKKASKRKIKAKKKAAAKKAAKKKAEKKAVKKKATKKKAKASKAKKGRNPKKK